MWTCEKCGHSFKWSGQRGEPRLFASDGSPAEEDPCWFVFQIAGPLSFLFACKKLSEKQRELLTRMMGEDPDTVGMHAVAFKHCLLERLAPDLLAVDEIMES